MTVGVQQNEVSRVIVGVMAILVVRLRRPARPLSRSAIRSAGNVRAAGLATLSDVRVYELFYSNHPVVSHAAQHNPSTLLCPSPLSPH